MSPFPNFIMMLSEETDSLIKNNYLNNLNMFEQFLLTYKCRYIFILTKHDNQLWENEHKVFKSVDLMKN